jgi:hypothetical protein
MNNPSQPIAAYRRDIGPVFVTVDTKQWLYGKLARRFNRVVLARLGDDDAWEACESGEMLELAGSRVVSFRVPDYQPR